MRKNKLESLVLLRAIAVLLVCFCHLGAALESDSSGGRFFTFMHRNGIYGVQIFFVVSGFVIPYSLLTSGYTLSHYPQFLWKRTLRLHPPYLLALLLTCGIAYASYRVRGLPYPETLTSVVYSFFYLNIPADNPVFWTLAIEAQYYLLIGMAFIFLKQSPRVAIPLLTALVLAARYTPLSQLISFFTHGCFFLVGTLAYLLYCRQGSRLMTGSALILVLVFIFWSEPFFASIATILALVGILGYHGPAPVPLAFIGEISYALYLLHFPVGVKFLNLANRYLSPSYNWVLFLTGLGLVIVAAWFFYRLVEKPFARLSSKIRYTSSVPRPQTT